MNATAPAFVSGTSVLPADLSRVQRGGLVVVVVLAHVLIAYAVLTRPMPAVKREDQPSIEVALIREAPSVVPQVVPMPVGSVEPVLVHAAKPSAQRVLTSAKPAQAQETTAIAPAPMVESKPVAAPVPTLAPAVPALATPSSLTTPVSDPTRPPARPLALPSSALRYLIEPKLNYPRVSRELGESGVVKLRVLIDEQGRPNGNDVAIVQSSGFPRLDQEAVRAMKAARFQPRVVDGVPRAVSTIASLEFNLEEQ